MGNVGRDRILTLQGELREDGIRTGLRKICAVFGFTRKKKENLVFITVVGIDIQQNGSLAPFEFFFTKMYTYYKRYI